MMGSLQAHLPRRLQAELIAGSVAINLLMLVMPLATLQVYDRVLTHPESGTLLMLAVGVGVAILMESWLRLMRVRLTTGMAQAYERARSARLVAHVVGSWVQPANSRHSGEYVQALSAIGRVRDFATQRLIAVTVDVPFVALYLALLALIGGVLAIVPLLAVTVMSALVCYWGVALRRAITARNHSDEQRYGFMLEALTGVHTIKALGLEPRFIHRFRNLQQEAGKSGLSIAMLNHALVSGGMMFSQIIVVLVVAAGAPMVMQGMLSMGGLIASVLISGRLIQPLQHALLCWMSYQEVAQGSAQIAHVEALPLQPFDRQMQGVARRGIVSCQAVNFRYSEENPLILQNVQFELQAGDIVALSGEAGSGRTTLLKMLAGLLAPQTGTVRVDEVDPATIPPHLLNQHVAHLGAEPVLMRGTILENLTCFDANMQDRAMEIARLIGLDALIVQLPGGFETVLDGGEAESIPPGMRQRIAIARALLHKPRLILFDQADRSLDREGYHQLFRLVARLKGKATLLLVTDDQNLIRLCNRRFALREGQMQEIGAQGRLQLVRTLGAA